MQMKTAEIFKAALLCLVAQSYPLCDPLTGARQAPLLTYVIFPIVVSII